MGPCAGDPGNDILATPGNYSGLRKSKARCNLALPHQTELSSGSWNGLQPKARAFTSTDPNAQKSNREQLQNT
jgi:hypothetical protein